MLKRDEIIRIVREVATANLPSRTVQDVLVEPTIDSVGQDAVRITIVIPPDTAARLGGHAVLDTLVQIRRRLRESGEDRSPIVGYATQEELEDVGDPES